MSASKKRASQEKSKLEKQKEIPGLVKREVRITSVYHS